MAKKKGDSPDKAELKDYYEDNGWKATISKYRIAPKDLSVLLGKSKAKKKAKAKEKAKPGKKRGPGRPRKDETVTPKKAPRKKKAAANTAAPKKKGKGGRKVDPLKLIDRTIEGLEKLRGVLAAA